MDNKIDCLKIFLEFLEVSFHNILFLRKIYPDGIFSLKKKYGVPVHVSVYPDLNGYITESLLYIKRLITSQDFRQVDLCFFDRFEKPLEKYIFSLSFIKAELTPDELLEGSDPYLTRLYESFRAFCLKLAVSTSYLQPLPTEASFKIHVHTSESSLSSLAEDPIFQNFPFMEVERHENSIDQPVIVPVRSLDTDMFKVETYIEETTNR